MSSPASTEDKPWSAFCLRLVVIVLPAELVGALVGALPTILLGASIIRLPWVAGLVPVGMGALAGVAVGRLSTPPGRLPAATAVAAGFGLAAFAVLRLLAQLRVSGASASPVSWLLGGSLVVITQAVVGVVLWRRRGFG